MQIFPITWDVLNAQIESVVEQITEGPTSTTYGIASFPAGIRHPQEGFSVQEGVEILFILSGEFGVETPVGTVSISENSFVTFPPGEPHATRAAENGRVAYVLINEIQE